MHLLLDKRTHDLLLSKEGGVCRGDKGRFVVQQVESKLRTLLGEWMLDTGVGYISREDLEKNYNEFELEARLIEIVIETQGVLSLDTIDFTYDNRVLHIQFTATTIYGVIDTTKPWDDTSTLEEVIFDPNSLLAITHNGVPVTFNGEYVYNNQIS